MRADDLQERGRVTLALWQVALILAAGIAATLVIAHERHVWERRRRASESLRREFPTVFGGPRL